MQLSLNKLVSAVLIAGLACVLPATAQTSDARREFAAFLSGLYERYAWVVVFALEPPGGKVPLAKASKKELFDVFVPDLALAIWNDTQCAKRHSEICVLDFDLLFDSQDPTARDLVISPGKLDAEAHACFVDAAETRRCLTFSRVTINGVIRIADIRYGGGQSLRHMLHLPAMKVPL